MSPTSNDMESIAERVLKFRSRSSGEEQVVRVRINRPHWTTEGVEASCLVSIEGVYGDLAPIRGIDPLDALRNAVRMIDRLLVGLRDKYEIYWSDGDEYDPIE